MRFGLMGRLRAPADDDSQGGGGTDKTDDKSKPTYVTLEQVNEIVTKAVTRTEKETVKKLQKGFDDRFGKLETILKAGKSDDDDTDDTDDEVVAPKPKVKGKGSEDPVVAAQLRQLAKKQEQTAKELEEERAALKTERERRATDLRNTALNDALTEAGIPAPRIKHAHAYLVGRVKTTEDGQHLFTTGEDDSPLADGVKEWAATEDGKSFLPPRDVRGSGEKGGGNRLPKPHVDPNSDEALIERAQQEVAEILGLDN